MNNEANRRLFALSYPERCWHDIIFEKAGDDVPEVPAGYYCIICGCDFFLEPKSLDYFNPDLPHSEVVRLVTAAVAKHSVADIAKAVAAMCCPDHVYSSDLVTMALMPAPQIAAAIDFLEKDA